MGMIGTLGIGRNPTIKIIRALIPIISNEGIKGTLGIQTREESNKGVKGTPGLPRDSKRGFPKRDPYRDS